MLRAATRASPLALWQTRHVAGLLGRPLAEVVVSTTGDRLADAPIHEIGGKGVFVSEVQAALIEGRADIAVHSAKDLPAATPPELCLAAVCSRADPRDALVGSRLDDLGQGARVATGSARRRVQLQALRPDLEFSELRGNIATRLAKAADFDAVVMAAAAIDRLGIDAGVVDRLDPEEMLPQVGQGALAVECRADDSETIGLLAGIDDPGVRPFVDAERACLAALGGDCSLPVGAYACAAGTGGAIRLRAMLATSCAPGAGVSAASSPTGSSPTVTVRLLKEERVGTDPVWLGHSVAHRLLDGAGAVSDAGLSVDPRS